MDKVRKKRLLNILMYDYLYSIKGDKYGSCTYCGIPAETLDHIPPISAVYFLSERAKEDFNFYKVPSCSECNSALNNTSLLSVAERHSYIRKFLKKKYKRGLRIPYWDEDELKELHSTMREEIKKANEQASWCKERITWMPSLALYNLTCYPDE